MKLKIEIDLDNDAFGTTYDEQHNGIKDVLESILSDIENNAYTQDVPMFERDLNGNKVAQIVFTEHDDSLVDLRAKLLKAFDTMSTEHETREAIRESLKMVGRMMTK